MRARAREACAQHPALSNEELAMARTLAGDLQAVWNAPTTEARDRKRLLRTLIEEVQLRTEPKRHLVRIVWKGGATTDRDIVRVRGGQLTATSEDTIDLVRKLAVDLDDFFGRFLSIPSHPGVRSPGPKPGTGFRNPRSGDR